VETQIGVLQEEMAEIDAIKAGKFWRENGEKSPRVFKNMATAKLEKKCIKQLRDPSTGDIVSAHEEKKNVILSFYKKLYTPEDINMDSIDLLLGSTTDRDDNRKLTVQQQPFLQQPITLAPIILGSQRSPRKSSPGSDGLPYEILSILMVIPTAFNLILKIYNDALGHGIFQNLGSNLLCA
jgi:hypothetical protein